MHTNPSTRHLEAPKQRGPGHGKWSLRDQNNQAGAIQNAPRLLTWGIGGLSLRRALGPARETPVVARGGPARA